jgi:hypothetical protein
MNRMRVEARLLFYPAATLHRQTSGAATPPTSQGSRGVVESKLCRAAPTEVGEGSYPV